METGSEKSLTLALSESSEDEGSVHEKIQKIIDQGSDHESSGTNELKIVEDADDDDDEVFVNPTPVINPIASKSSTVLNTPVHVPATPGRDWTSDGTFCPAPERQLQNKSNPNNTELTNLANTSLTTRPTPELPQPTPFQTPPPSVSYSSSAPTPEHPQMTCISAPTPEHPMTPADSEVASPIQPPDLFKDDEEVKPRAPMVISDEFRTLDKSVVKDWLGQRAVLKLPESTHNHWSDDEGDKGSDWSDAAWSEDDEPKPQSFSQLFNSTRAHMTPMTPRMGAPMMTPRMTPHSTNQLILPPMTPRSQEISQILDSLAYSPSMTV